MNWIGIKDQLPDDFEECWIFDLNKDMLAATFKVKLLDSRSFPTSYRPGFHVEAEPTLYLFLEQITHWMPYFTPEPPKETE